MGSRIAVGALTVLLVFVGAAWGDHDITVPYTAPEGTASIDADLSDWAGAQWIALDEVYDGTPDDVTDAKYALRWSDADNLLYFAVEVTDTQPNKVDFYVSWNTQDDIEVSVDAGNNDAYFGSPPGLGQQIIFGEAPDGTDWVIAAWGNPADVDLVPSYRVATVGDVISYEGAIVPYSNYAAWGAPGDTTEVDLAEGIEIGFDVVAVTKLDEATAYGMLTNNTVGGKFQNGASLQAWLLGTGPAYQADFDGDGDVDLDDFVILKNNFGLTPPADGDADGDGDVDLDDFVILKNEFGT